MYILIGATNIFITNNLKFCFLYANFHTVIKQNTYIRYLSQSFPIQEKRDIGKEHYLIMFDIIAHVDYINQK